MFWQCLGRRPVETWYIAKSGVLWCLVWLFLLLGLLWLIRRVTGLLSLLWRLVLEARRKADLFDGDSASSTLSFEELKINLPVQLDEVSDLAFPELPDQLVLQGFLLPHPCQDYLK